MLDGPLTRPRRRPKADVDRLNAVRRIVQHQAGFENVFLRTAWAVQQPVDQTDSHGAAWTGWLGGGQGCFPAGGAAREATEAIQQSGLFAAHQRLAVDEHLLKKAGLTVTLPGNSLARRLSRLGLKRWLRKGNRAQNAPPADRQKIASPHVPTPCLQWKSPIPKIARIIDMPIITGLSRVRQRPLDVGKATS